MSYADFLNRKRRVFTGAGMTANGLPDVLYPWQKAIVRWALRKGRAAIFADCGLGKTLMQVAWAQALDQRTIFFAPLCVAEQTALEAQKIGVSLRYARNEVEAIGAQFVITNYERIDDFDMANYNAVVLDESSILKAFDGKTRKKLIDVCAGVTYRLCCTATPSPNDIAELANHAEFLGLMTWAEFMATWFVHDDAGWRMKKHAVKPFYRWMASWAVALRKPSDIGYDDDGFALPKLTIKDVVVESDAPVGDSLFPEMGLRGLTGRLNARRASLTPRVSAAARLVRHTPTQCQWLVWCGLNAESDAVASALPDAVNVSGNDTYAEKVGAVHAFLAGTTRTLVSKAKVLGFGMNFQNAHHMAFVGLGDSFESYYQCVRRSWRFGQKHEVTAYIIVSEAERVIVENVRRKEAAAASLSAELLANMVEFEREEISA